MIFPALKYSLPVLLVSAFLCWFSLLMVDPAFDSTAYGARKARYDIIYFISDDLEQVLDYKEDLDSVLPRTILKKLKIVGRGNDYALLYDGNDSAKTVTKTLISQAELLDKVDLNEPFATKEQDFHSLYNVSYGMGPNFEPLKKKYAVLYSCLGDDVKQDLFIEKTEYGNYKLVYRYRGDERSAGKIAKEHARILRSKKIRTSLAIENNNTVVYGESSLIDDAPAKIDQACKGESIAPEASGSKKIAKILLRPKQEPIKLKVSASSPVIERSATIFEETIEDYIQNLRNKGKISGDEATGWMVYDLARDKPLVDINADRQFQAASMIKPFVALAFFHQVKQKKFIYGPKSRRKMEAMIQRSSNSATNWIMRQAGGPAACDAILKKYYSNIFQQTRIREYIPANGRTYLNSSPPAEYVRFLRALWNQELPYGKEIRRLMALPGRDRLYYGTPIPRGTLVYNKTGTTAHLCGDMGILVPKTRKGNQYPYVIVGIIERQSRPANYGQWMASRSKVIRQVSTLVYKEMKKEHQLR